MNTKRIEEIQKETAYPDSISVQQALLKVWNECEQEKVVKNNAVLPFVSHSRLQNLKTYWVNYDNEWQPTKAHIPFENAPLYFKFLNGMIVECSRIDKENIKPLCYCG